LPRIGAPLADSDPDVMLAVQAIGEHLLRLVGDEAHRSFISAESARVLCRGG
jgi:hypothetical protein